MPGCNDINELATQIVAGGNGQQFDFTGNLDDRDANLPTIGATILGTDLSLGFHVLNHPLFEEGLITDNGRDILRSWRLTFRHHRRTSSFCTSSLASVCSVVAAR